MKTAALGFATASLLFASSLAHALLGWPAMEQALSTESIDPALTGALAVGWYFGSASMLLFAFVVGYHALRRLRGAVVDRVSLFGIAAMYVLFGSTAWAIRSLNAHFLLFVVTGLLVGAFAALCSQNRSSRKRQQRPDHRDPVVL
jgi:hypothetical protein